MNSQVIEIPCSKCGKTKKMELFKIIEVNENKEQFKKINDKTLFNCTCEECGTTDLCRYPFICYDKQKKIAFLFSKNEDATDNDKRLKNLGVKEIEDIESYTTRTVTTFEDLNEKFSMFKEGLNDAIVEVAKIWFKHNSDVDIYELRFHEIKDDFIHWIVCFDGKIMGARLPMDFYRESLEEWEVYIPNNFPIVNESNLDLYIKRIK